MQNSADRFMNERHIDWNNSEKKVNFFETIELNCCGFCVLTPLHSGRFHAIVAVLRIDIIITFLMMTVNVAWLECDFFFCKNDITG